MEKFYIQQIGIDELSESRKGVRQLCGCILMISGGPRDSLSSISLHLESELTADA